MAVIKDLIIGEMGDPGVGDGDRCSYFKLTPESKYKNFDEFEAWFTSELTQGGDVKVVTV